MVVLNLNLFLDLDLDFLLVNSVAVAGISTNSSAKSVATVATIAALFNAVTIADIAVTSINFDLFMVVLNFDLFLDFDFLLLDTVANLAIAVAGISTNSLAQTVAAKLLDAVAIGATVKTVATLLDTVAI